MALGPGSPEENRPLNAHSEANLAAAVVNGDVVADGAAVIAAVVEGVEVLVVVTVVYGPDILHCSPAAVLGVEIFL